MTSRHDIALILARGRSLRMGCPKGLCRLEPDGPTFLEMITHIYREFGMQSAIVTIDDLAAIYRPAAADCGAELIPYPTGGETATTVLAGVQALRQRATHLWLHPVDLPHVRSETLTALMQRSRMEPGRAVIPQYDLRPGHPVVLPIASWLHLAPQSFVGRMQDLLRQDPARFCILETSDEGVCRDYDSPEELQDE